MRISRINGKRAVTGGLLLAAACAAAVPAVAAHADTRVTLVNAGPQVGDHAARPMGIDGCSNGTVCMYTSPPNIFSTPEHYWTKYGCSDLGLEVGWRWVFNNQYGGATATLWSGFGCTGTHVTIQQGEFWSGEITPYESISLNA